MTTRTLPAPPADDLFSGDFITAQDLAVRDARINSGRKVALVEAPVVEAPVTCKRCGRRLSSESSCAAGYGPVCARRMRNALTDIGTAFKAHQIVSATELIADGGVVVGPGRTCIAVSSDGARTYVVDVTAGTCTCKAGEYGRRCFHLAASIALTV
jgi:hypothetical protein